MMTIRLWAIPAVLALGLAACATAPKSPEAKDDLVTQAQATLAAMKRSDASLSDLLGRSYAYAVFPSIGKGGVVVGGAYGRGVAFKGDKPVGYVELNQASIGAQLGGETFSELIALQDEQAYNKLVYGGLRFGAEANAVALKAGAGAATDFMDGTAVIVEPRGGLMAGLTVSGQEINFQPTQSAQR